MLVERALQPLDDLRGGLLRTLGAFAPFRRLLATRNTRVPLLLSIHATVAFTLALLLPSLSLALAPIFLGVPHVVSDVRHMVIRRALPRWWLRTIVAFAGALLLVRLLEEASPLHAAPIVVENGVGVSWLLFAALGGAVLGGWRRTAPVVVAFAVVFAVGALAEPRGFRFAFLHGHNLLAVAIWLLLFRRRGGLAWLPVALILIGGGLLATGALLGVTVHHGTLSLFGLHLFAAADWIAPGLPDRWALGLTTAFAFLQSVHYAIWLVAIPQDDVRVGGATTFRMAWRDMARDLGGGGLWIALALVVVALVAGMVALARTRVLLLSLATFHAWMEIAMLAFFLARDGIAPQRRLVATG
jgi:hypothetical protein